MDILKNPESNIMLSEDHRTESTQNQYVLILNGKILATVARQNFNQKKFKANGILNNDAEALANANLFLAAPDMYEALHSLLDVITAKHEGGDEVIAAIRKNQIIKAKKAIQKAKRYV